MAAGNVDLIPLDVPRQEMEKPVEGSTVVAREILGCHSTLVVSSFFLYSSTFCCAVEYFCELINEFVEFASFCGF